MNSAVRLATAMLMVVAVIVIVGREMGRQAGYEAGGNIKSLTDERPDGADELTGHASVIDGDTIEIRGRRVRLHGIDAPESNQICAAQGKPYRCGQQAALALSDFLGDRTIRCQPATARKGWERIIARCAAGGTDAGEWLVEQGWAIAYVKYSNDYLPAEERAKTRCRGLWRGTFAAPEDWRRKRRDEVRSVAPCLTPARG